MDPPSVRPRPLRIYSHRRGRSWHTQHPRPGRAPNDASNPNARYARRATTPCHHRHPLSTAPTASDNQTTARHGREVVRPASGHSRSH